MHLDVAETAQRVFREAAYHSARLHVAPSPIVLRGRPVARWQARGWANIRLEKNSQIGSFGGGPPDVVEIIE